MARQKDWTADDKARALQWLINKGMGALRETAEAGTATLERLASIEDLSEFGRAIEAALLPEAWKRLLATLRQHKHLAQQDDDDGKADAGAQQTDAGACASCAALQVKNGELERELNHAISVATDTILGLKAEAESLQQQLASEAKLLAEHMQPIRQANDGDPTALVDWLRQHLFPGSTWYRFASAINASQAKVKIETIGADAGESITDEKLRAILAEDKAARWSANNVDEDGHQVQVIDRTHSSSAPAAVEPNFEPEHPTQHPGDQSTHTVHEIAALALARSYMAEGKTKKDALRTASWELRNALGCGLGEGEHLAVLNVHRLLQDSEGKAITLESKTTRDEVIVLLFKAGMKYRPLARALGISDGTARNVIKKRRQQEAEAV
ncbi:MAG: hypothetical protein K9L32_01400 [Chromatiaceae bacterium]|nr:hypothetical protein [Chromatiaceae bacterium]MCF8002861.1 hypothetical protein [Chromatiaceae bacterium]